MPPIPVRVPDSFKRQLDKKPAQLAAAITECAVRLAEKTRHPSLRTHPIRGHPGVFEAYVDRANRLTFEYGAGEIVLRKHCSHDVLRRP